MPLIPALERWRQDLSLRISRDRIIHLVRGIGSGKETVAGLLCFAELLAFALYLTWGF